MGANSICMHILIGFLLAGFGFLLVWKTVGFLDFVGRSDWAEEKFGPGGTQTFLKLLGVGLIMAGFIIITNLHVGVLQGLAGLFVRPQ